MLKKSLILFPMLLLVVSIGFSQGRGRSQRQGQGSNQGQGQVQGQSPGQRGAQAGSTDREQKRVHATKQQRDQIRSCDKLADGIRKQARKMAQSSGSKFNIGETNRQRNQIADQFKAMEQEHEQLMNGLDATQQQVWQEHIRNTNQLRQQVNTHLQQMDAEMNSANPDSKRIAEHARVIEQTMNDWRKQYNTLYSQASS
jgi:hypothetical protein